MKRKIALKMMAGVLVYDEVGPVKQSWWRKALRLPKHKHGACQHTDYHIGIDWAINFPRKPSK